MRTFGSLKSNARMKKFGIECEPHVTMRLKRVFGKFVLEGIRDHARKAAALVDFDQMTLVLEFHGVDYPDRCLIFTMSKLHGRCLMGFADEEPVRATSSIIEKAFKRLNEQKPKKPRKRQPKKAEAIV